MVSFQSFLTGCCAVASMLVRVSLVVCGAVAGASPVTDTEQSIADCATDTSGFSGLYQCNDVVDNDTDGRADVNDPGCRSGYDNLEAY